jgi:hypothetical protein
VLANTAICLLSGRESEAWGELARFKSCCTETGMQACKTPVGTLVEQLGRLLSEVVDGGSVSD